ncbi:MAG: response regulator [Polyangia bacterium]
MAPVPALKILLVEDEPSILFAVRDVLESASHSIVATATAEEALHQMLAQPFDLLLTDIDLPGMSGLELCRHARRNSSSLDVVLMTTNARHESCSAAVKQGACGYLIKPFDLEELLVQVADVAEQRSLKQGAARAAALLAAESAGLVHGHAESPRGCFMNLAAVAAGSSVQS